jgi:hypothetical protein
MYRRPSSLDEAATTLRPDRFLKEGGGHRGAYESRATDGKDEALRVTQRRVSLVMLRPE